MNFVAPALLVLAVIALELAGAARARRRAKHRLLLVEELNRLTATNASVVTEGWQTSYDRDTFEVFFGESFGRAFETARQRVENPSICEDIVTESYLQLLHDFPAPPWSLDSLMSIVRSKSAVVAQQVPPPDEGPTGPAGTVLRRLRVSASAHALTHSGRLSHGPRG